MDNSFIERLWRSLKYEAVYLHELFGRLPGPGGDFPVGGVLQLPAPSLGLGGSTPAEAYDRGLPAETRKKPFRSTPSFPLPPEHDDVLNRTLAA